MIYKAYKVFLLGLSLWRSQWLKVQKLGPIGGSIKKYCQNILAVLNITIKGLLPIISENNKTSYLHM